MRESPKYVQVYNKLFSMIKDAQFPEGSKLPSEAELVEKFSVSRVTIRIALSLLKEDGIINSIHGRGHFVNSTNDDDSSRGLNDFSNPLINCLDAPFKNLATKEAYFSFNPSSPYTDKLFSVDSKPYYTLNVWYKYEKNFIANTFSIILPQTVERIGLEIEKEINIINFLEKDIYKISKNSQLTVIISTRNTDTFRYGFENSGTLVLLTENLYGIDGELIAQNKHYILEEYFKTFIVRYKK